MIEIFPNIHLIPSEFSVGFSYFVTRPRGNLLIPNGMQAAEFGRLIELLDAKGGVETVLACCKHNVKAASATAAVCTHYGARLLIGAPDARGGAITPGSHVSPLPFKDSEIGADLEFIPLVGYTSGSGGYVLRNGDRKYLFTGVTLCHKEGVWKVWTSATRARKCIEGFERIKQMPFDVMFINSFSNTPPTWYSWSHTEKAAVFDEAISQARSLIK